MPLGLSSIHSSSLTFSRFIFQISFRLRLYKKRDTSIEYYKFLRRYTFRCQLSWLNVQIFHLVDLLLLKYDLSISCFQCQELKCPCSTLRTHNPVSKSTLQKRQVTFRILHRFASISLLDICRIYWGLLPIFIMSH